MKFYTNILNSLIIEASRMDSTMPIGDDTAFPPRQGRRARLHYLRDRVGKEAVTVKTIR